ncbi:MAG: oxidoreductase [Burkholderiaceae bacterium]|nr:oxidoreductase [Burkholderiaceae bacterium]
MLKLLVRSIRLEARNIHSFELVDPDGRELPPFEAGAHIDVCLPNGLIRQYSLYNPPWDRSGYRIAVLEVENSRGGSLAMHHEIRVGDMLQIDGPRNLFPLHQDSDHSILIAAGIGITPLLAMLNQLEKDNRSYELHYCTKTPVHTAFLEQLEKSIRSGRTRIYHDNGDPSKGLQLSKLLSTRSEDTHLYYCGPPGFMEAVKNATTDWPSHTVHSEYFAAPKAVTQSDVEPVQEFEVLLDRSQVAVRVMADESILNAVRKAGIECTSSCETGVCGACRVRYLQGTPEHHDYILSDEEKEEYVLICCARSSSKYLVLDL